jgi:hypothetical protein
MPTKSRSARPKPRSASKQTTTAKRRDRSRSAAKLPKNPDGSQPQGSVAPLSAQDAPGELAIAVTGAPPRHTRQVVGGAEHAITGSGAPHPSVEKTPAKASAESERFQPMVGPPESASPTAALDHAQRAASKNDERAMWDALPAGTIIESLGPVHGYRATGPGMHRPTGTGRTPLDAVKNIGVPLIRDEELPEDKKSEARRAQEEKERIARAQATPIGGGAAAPAPAPAPAPAA